MEGNSGQRETDSNAGAGNFVPPDFRQRKLSLTLAIMGAGMAIALVWCAVAGWGLGRGYPYNTILASPDYRFNDLTDMTLDASRPDPYSDPFAPYLPFAWVYFRVLSALPYVSGLVTFLFIGVGGLFILLFTVLANVIGSPWKRGLLSLMLLVVSYPVLFTLDRANVELWLVLLIAGFLYFLARAKYGIGTFCLLAVASFKFYPAIFLLLLLRQRQLGLAAFTIVALLVVVYLSLAILGLPLEDGFEFYGRNLLFFTRYYAYENYSIEGASSLWNAYKLGLISAAHFGLISPVDFNFDSPFIGASLFIYNCGAALFTLALAVYVCLVEKEFLRCAMALLLYLSSVTPFGADYRLLYANIALVLLVLIQTRRPHDMLILVLLALAMVPKKELFLEYAGHTESGAADVSIQVLLNPVLILAALLLLLYDCRAHFTWRWTQLRLRRQIRMISSGQSVFDAGKTLAR